MTPERLIGIEACRGVAASLVVVFHSARHLDRAFGPSALSAFFTFGHAGVDLFFVISGFVIYFVHRGDVGRPGRFGSYAWRRVTRIYPTYWVALACTVLLSTAGGHALPSLFEVAWSAVLFPSYVDPLLSVAWTLQYEIVFYVVFGLLILRRWAGRTILMAWLAGVILLTFLSYDGVIPNSLYNVYNVEFFLGMGVAHRVSTARLARPRMVLCLGLLLFLAVALAENAGFVDGSADYSRPLYSVPAAVIVLGVAEAERRGLIVVPDILRHLGRASYSIYLFQFVFIGVTWKLWLAAGLDVWLSPLLLFPVLVAAGVIGGLATSRLVEYPLMHWIRRSFRLARSGTGR